METTITVEVVGEIPKELARVVTQTGIEPVTAQSLVASYKPFFSEVNRLLEDAKAINVTDATQVTMINEARKLRLALRKQRTDADKCREALKAESLRRSNAIQGMYNVLRFMTEPVEEKLLAAEEFAERVEAKRLADRREARLLALKPYGVDTAFFDLTKMPEDQFAKLLTGAKEAHEKAEAEKARLEAERIAREKAQAEERERIRLENIRLKEEAEKREAAAKAERERHQKEIQEAAERAAAERKARDAADAKAKAEREAAEKKAQEDREAKAAAEKKHRDAEIAAMRKKSDEERAAREKAEREAAAARQAELDRQAQEKKRQDEERERQRKAAAAPDRDKLLNYANAIRALDTPALATKEAGSLLNLVLAQRDKFIDWIESKAAAL